MLYFFLLLILPESGLGSESLVVKFADFQGAGCAHRASSSSLFVDRFSNIPRQTAIPWSSLKASEYDRKRLNIPETEIPAAAEPIEFYFRFYAVHDHVNADHYESTLRITKELLVKLRQAGGRQRHDLPMTATYQPEQNRKCVLVLDMAILPE